MFDFHALLSAEGLVSLISLTVMEIVLGIDNVLLVAILSQKVKAAHRNRVRKLGIGLALVLRIGLLFTLTWLILAVLFFPITWLLSIYFVRESEKIESEAAAFAHQTLEPGATTLDSSMDLEKEVDR